MRDEKNERSYEDIIDLPHHTSPTRARMSRIDRAAQFGAFMALTGYEDQVAETARLTEEWTDMAEDAKLIVDEKLRILAEHLADRVEVTVTYFVPDERKAGGAYVRKTGVVKLIDAFEQCLVLTDKTLIPIADIRDLGGVLFEHFEMQ